MYKFTGKVLLCNAPPNAGKDSITEALCKALGSSHSEFKEELYKATANLFKVPYGVLRGLAVDRETKEEVNDLLYLTIPQYNRLCRVTGGEFAEAEEEMAFITPREALIYTSEVHIKPMYGKTYFGEKAAEAMDLEKGAIFSDSGFNEEMMPIIEKVGKDNVYVVKFTREGADDFEGDSRDWLEVPKGVACLETTNDGTIQELADEILSWLENSHKADNNHAMETFHS